MLLPLANSIYFIFEDETTNTKFVNKTASGLIISNAVDGHTVADQANIPRWGTVIDVGPDCTEVKPGDYILIEKGKWTQSFQDDDLTLGLKLWKTDENEVLCVSDEPQTAY